MTFLDWLSANPIGILFLGLAANVFMIIAVVAFVQGRTIELWPPKIGAKNEVPRQRVLVDTVPFPKEGHANFWDGSYPHGRDVNVPVRFKVPFSHKPDVIVSLQMLDAGVQILRVKVEARNITPEGFDLRFETWKESLVWNVIAAWVAVGT
jgi:hypothetical protein